VKRYDTNGRDVTELHGLHDESDTECQEPCHPDSNCQHCAGYWERMEEEELWDRESGRWTDAGMSDIIRHA